MAACVYEHMKINILKIDGGLLSCGCQTARKLGSIQERKKPCKNVRLEKMKRMRKERWKNCISKG